LGKLSSLLLAYRFRIIVTILTILIIYWYATTHVDWETLSQTAVTIHWEYFWLGTFLAVVSNWLDGLAWYRILNFIDRRIRAFDALMSHWIGFTLGILIPIAGTVELASKTAILKHKYPGLSSEEIISSIAAIRTVFLVTGYGSYAYLVISLGFEGIIDPFFTIILLLIVWIALTIFIVLIFVLFSNTDKLFSIIALIGKPIFQFIFFKNKLPVIEEWLNNFGNTFRNCIFKMPRREKIIMLLTVFSQNIIKWISIYFIYLAVVDLPLWAVMISSTVGNFVNLIPAAIPGLLGAREIVYQLSINFFLNDSNLSLIAAIVQSLGLWIFFILTGLVGIPYIFISSKQMNKLEKKKNEALNDV
jgi:uncharacterized membrane protein YbhN (UPF0104 family)